LCVGLFALSVGVEGQIPFLPDSPDSHGEGDETAGVGQIRFNLAFSVLVYKILLAVIAFDYVPGFLHFYI